MAIKIMAKKAKGRDARTFAFLNRGPSALHHFGTSGSQNKASCFLLKMNSGWLAAAEAVYTFKRYCGAFV